jgi:hypothetical protein
MVLGCSSALGVQGSVWVLGRMSPGNCSHRGGCKMVVVVVVAVVAVVGRVSDARKVVLVRSLLLRRIQARGFELANPVGIRLVGHKVCRLALGCCRDCGSAHRPQGVPSQSPGHSHNH